jgi:hypothetical protein
LNQLKCVSKQLFRETAGIEIQGSPVFFLNGAFKQAMALRSFLRFYSHRTPNKRFQWHPFSWEEILRGRKMGKERIR